ncbi:MAG: hypothetical protein NVS1B14_10160 [Vulcanimicrobiaceae bacterium]
MSTHAIAISLKIPDNEARTALAALVRLGVRIDAVERADVWLIEYGGPGADLVKLVRSDEVLFNPNKHALEPLASLRPRGGEIWVEPLDRSASGKMISGIGAAKRVVAWRMWSGNRPATREILQAAAQALLCNSAIERALF